MRQKIRQTNISRKGAKTQKNQDGFEVLCASASLRVNKKTPGRSSLPGERCVAVGSKDIKLNRDKIYPI
jgi:hypothetical protein